MKTPSFRAAVAWAIALGLHGAGAASAPLPARNLLVEVRERAGDDAVAPIPGRAAQGGQGWSVNSREGWSGSTVAQTTRTQAARGHGVTRALVQNGQEASVELRSTHPVQWWVVQVGASASGASGGKPAYVRGEPVTTWVDTGQTWHVRVRWDGGTRVRVDIRALSEQPLDPNVTAGADSGDVARRQEVATSLELPVGRWVTVAGTRSEAPDPAPGWRVGSGDASRSDDDFDVQVRVSLPAVGD